ncbi:MAG: hypothetical protein ACLR2G_05040 [Phascolarctobacterium faecium]
MRSAAEVEVAKMKVTTGSVQKNASQAKTRPAMFWHRHVRSTKLTSEADEHYRTMIADAEERSRTLLADTDEKVEK